MLDELAVIIDHKCIDPGNSRSSRWQYSDADVSAVCFFGDSSREVDCSLFAARRILGANAAFVTAGSDIIAVLLAVVASFPLPAKRSRYANKILDSWLLLLMAMQTTATTTTMFGRSIIANVLSK